MKFENLLQQAKMDVEEFIWKYPNGIVIIWWATATWKSRLSVELAEFFDIEIISSDCRQIFENMDIWTDKIPKKYQDKIPHHQIDIVTPEQHYTAWEWQKDAKKQIKEIQWRNRIPFVVGGTGLYIDTIYKNYNMPEIEPNYEFRKKLEKKESENPWFLYDELFKIDPVEAKKLHPNSTRYLIRALEIYEFTWKTKTELYADCPVDQPILMLGIWRDKESTNKLIDARIYELLEKGLVDELRSLMKKYDPRLQSMQSIGYKEFIGFVNWENTLEEAVELLKRNTYHLAKKQRTRFRRYINDMENNPKKNVVYKFYEIE